MGCDMEQCLMGGFVSEKNLGLKRYVGLKFAVQKPEQMLLGQGSGKKFERKKVQIAGKS